MDTVVYSPAWGLVQVEYLSIFNDMNDINSLFFSFLFPLNFFHNLIMSWTFFPRFPIDFFVSVCV